MLLKSLVQTNYRVAIKRRQQTFCCKYAPQWLIKNADYKIGKSMFRLPTESSMVSSKISNVQSGEIEKVLTTKLLKLKLKKFAFYIVSH